MATAWLTSKPRCQYGLPVCGLCCGRSLLVSTCLDDCVNRSIDIVLKCWNDVTSNICGREAGKWMYGFGKASLVVSIEQLNCTCLACELNTFNSFKFILSCRMNSKVGWNATNCCMRYNTTLDNIINCKFNMNNIDCISATTIHVDYILLT